MQVHSVDRPFALSRPLDCEPSGLQVAREVEGHATNNEGRPIEGVERDPFRGIDPKAGTALFVGIAECSETRCCPIESKPAEVLCRITATSSLKVDNPPSVFHRYRPGRCVAEDRDGPARVCLVPTAVNS